MNKFVAFSGGKDSTALALLEEDATPVFTDTGWEFDEVYAHIEKFERVTGRQVVRIKRADGFTLPEYIKSAAFMPGHGARYCTRMFKIDPYNAYIKQFLPAELCIGLRADEPADVRVGNLTEIEGLTIRYPLRERNMALADVIRLCLKFDLLPRNPVYMARGGCKGCFYKRTSEITAMSALVPEVMDELQEIEESVQDERGKFAYMFPNAGRSIREIRSQQWLLDPNEVYAAAADKSDMGENCGLFCNR